MPFSKAFAKGFSGPFRQGLSGPHGDGMRTLTECLNRSAVPLIYNTFPSNS
jgi:hypothetical protein